VLKSLYTIIDDVKRKPYDLLDYSRNQFDRDYLEFNVNIHDLEISLLVRLLAGLAQSSCHAAACCFCCCTAAATSCWGAV
jgi:dynein heavy chain